MLFLCETIKFLKALSKAFFLPLFIFFFSLSLFSLARGREKEDIKGRYANDVDRFPRSYFKRITERLRSTVISVAVYLWPVVVERTVAVLHYLRKKKRKKEERISLGMYVAGNKDITSPSIPLTHPPHLSSLRT